MHKIYILINVIGQDQDHIFGDLDVIKAEVQGVQNKLSNLNQSNVKSLQSRIEFLENQARNKNIKLFNLPSHYDQHLSDKVFEILVHVYPTLVRNEVIQCRRLQANRNQHGSDGGPSANRPDPVLVCLSSDVIVTQILRGANKQLRTRPLVDHDCKGVRMTDDVSPYIHEQRKKLMPKMQQLRNDGLLALIPFSKTAKLIYRQGNVWKTIWPDN